MIGSWHNLAFFPASFSNHRSTLLWRNVSWMEKKFQSMRESNLFCRNLCSSTNDYVVFLSARSPLASCQSPIANNWEMGKQILFSNEVIMIKFFVKVRSITIFPIVLRNCIVKYLWYLLYFVFYMYLSVEDSLCDETALMKIFFTTKWNFLLGKTVEQLWNILHFRMINSVSKL